MKRIIYADNAATTQMDIEAYEAMKPYLLQQFGNASQPYSFARQPKKAIQEARQIISSSIGALPEEIYFTSGGTESDNWAIKGIASHNKNRRDIITTSFEHHAILRACKAIEQAGRSVSYMQPNNNGFVPPESLAHIISDKTLLVSVMYANNEIGSIQPISETGRRSFEPTGLFCPIYKAFPNRNN